VSARTTLEATGARAIISGGLRFPADQVDIAPALPRPRRAPSGLPEIQLFAVGTPDALIARSTLPRCLHGWRCGRSIVKRVRMDSIERGEPPPRIRHWPASTASSVPSLTVPDAAGPDQPSLDAPRRVPLKPRLVARARPALAPAPPAVGQQVAPLPPASMSARSRFGRRSSRNRVRHGADAALAIP